MDQKRLELVKSGRIDHLFNFEMEVQICRPDTGNVPTAGVDGFEHAGRGVLNRETVTENV